MTNDVTGWTRRKVPDATELEGRWVLLQRLDADAHAGTLYASTVAPGAEARFRYLPDNPPADRAAFDAWLAQAEASADPLYYAVVDRETGRTEGRQTLMRITPEHGVVEIGNILWGPAMARTRLATEALYLFARYAFDELGYRRFEWKCNAANLPSRRAAERFGFAFEGIFRQHMIVKGESRDTAWFAMIDDDWPRLRAGYERWLDPHNFGADGAQRETLAASLAASA